MDTRRVSGLTNNMKLHNGHYLSLPKIQVFLLDQPSDLSKEARRIWATAKILEVGVGLESDLVAVCDKVKKDLVRKLLLQDGKSTAKLDSWNNAKLQELLDKPDVWFSCTICNSYKNPYTWSNVPAHPCTANEKGQETYAERTLGCTTACIPVGWQSDVIELADGFKGLHTLLETLSRAKQTEQGLSIADHPFRFPSSHSAIKLDNRWKFKCAVGSCWTGHTRLVEIVSSSVTMLADNKMLTRYFYFLKSIRCLISQRISLTRKLH